MNTTKRYLLAVCCTIVMAACSQSDAPVTYPDDTDIIHVGSVSAGNMTTRADAEPSGQAAETIPWLKEVLASGIDMTYQHESGSRKARLKLEVDGGGNIRTSEGGITIYSLNTYDSQNNLTSVPARWLGNGAHTFQGVYIPDGLREQKAHQEYTDLLHYTAIPPKADIQATVGLITIPLQHRLARVVAYVLIVIE